MTHSHTDTHTHIHTLLDHLAGVNMGVDRGKGAVQHS